MNFSNKDLSYNIFNKMDFTDVDFSYSNLENTEFIECKLTNTKFNNSVLTNVKFTKSIDITNAQFTMAIYEEGFPPIGLTETIMNCILINPRDSPLDPDATRRLISNL